MENEQISFDTLVKTDAEQLMDAVQKCISDKEQYGRFIEVVQNIYCGQSKESSGCKN